MTNNMNKTMTTRTVKFSHGTAKDAALQIPVGPYCIDDIVSLIRESYLDYAFRDGCGLMSDEVLTSSIGHSSFFDGALGGYESRLSADMFKLVKSYAKDDCAQALAVARYRMGPDATDSEVYLRASKNEVLDQHTRKFLADAAAYAARPAAEVEAERAYCDQEYACIGNEERAIELRHDAKSEPFEG